MTTIVRYMPSSNSSCKIVVNSCYKVRIYYRPFISPWASSIQMTFGERAYARWSQCMNAEYTIVRNLSALVVSNRCNVLSSPSVRAQFNEGRVTSNWLDPAILLFAFQELVDELVNLRWRHIRHHYDMANLKMTKKAAGEHNLQHNLYKPSHQA